jgi:spore coat protein A
VNGALYPYLEVEPRPYRLRILNNANSRFFNLYLNLAPRPTDTPRLVLLHQIGTDGGFLPQTCKLSKLLLGPAERADIIVDFSNLNGKTVTLSNNAPAPYPGWEFAHAVPPRLHELMQFRVTRPLTGPAPIFSFPGSSEFRKLALDRSTVTRDFVLTEKLAGSPRPPAANEAGWKDTAVVRPGEVLSILVRFEGYVGRYVFHCHMLEHEDNDMMRPYEVIA